MGGREGEVVCTKALRWYLLKTACNSTGLKVGREWSWDCSKEQAGEEHR